MRICKKPVRTLSSSPTPMMHTMAGMPQIKLLTAVLTAVIVSIMIFTHILCQNTSFSGRNAGKQTIYFTAELAYCQIK